MKERIITWTLALLCIASFAWATDYWIHGDVRIHDADPAVSFTDSSTDDLDVNAKIYADATDTGTGTEDVDMYFQQQIAGALTTWLHADADGNLNFQDRNITTTGTVTGSGGVVTDVTDTYFPYSNSGTLADSPLTTDGTDVTNSGELVQNDVFTVNPDGTNEVFQVNDGSLDFTDGNAGTTGTLTVDSSGNWSYNKNISVGSLTTRQSSESVADEAEITLATGVSGWGFAQAGDNEQWIQFCFTAAGVVTVIANSANAVNTDTDGNLCVYDAGSGIAIKNRLGSSKTIRYLVHYSA